MASAKDFSTIPANATQQPTPFGLHVDEQKLQDFKTLLRLSPVARETYENQQEDRRFGVTRKWMLDAKEYWENSFDWRKEEEHINSFPNFKTNITDDDGTTLDIHFTALFSERKDATPIVFFHGWPGSFLEFLPIMSLLREKYTPSDLPYHIIAPSLPGYTLSKDLPISKNWTVYDTARIMHKLALSLGFGTSGYLVQGGDIGSFVSRIIAATYPECKGMHLNFMHMQVSPPGISPDSITPQEQIGLERCEQFKQTGSAYGREHGTRPATIGHVLSSSPIAQLAWIGEKFLEWTDEDLPLRTVLADITLYWLCESFPSSIYTYREDYASRDGGYFHGQKHLYVDKPTGYSYFPKELAPIPRSWAETSTRLVVFKAHESGGHFAALEKPEALWKDIEEYVQVAFK
ncbi:hypothetical protein BU24DRAFT_496971 [Aaosphaeria arxii CBS 175.79]|uniref:Epoxide hydrolase N-terminal domain-containing protein n=1 Tax=Aaosphaeria arxii CBS 175.79 TaxID=1450172 RepID=A0A6A5XBB5_9PLEO|nr:uncharacterized protein BU24DRAFT_496971 [Aaosphaeria arxii CBS 175.79]KAF2010210.1 hypothetical protein BU24DRAFT_496971 [Aaosphaeria arxii CBS 175.79]